MATTLPEVLSNSSLPSTTKLAGATNPLIESRSCFRTITFLWVEDMGSCFVTLLVRLVHDHRKIHLPRSFPLRGYVFAYKSVHATLGFSHFPGELGQIVASQ